MKIKCDNPKITVLIGFPTLFVAAQLHILTLLEHIKEQQMQLATAVNNLAARMGTETPVAEMPHKISLPLATMSEVEDLEQWLKNPANARAKQNMVTMIFIFPIIL